MAKLEDQLAKLSSLEIVLADGSSHPAAVEALKKALGTKSNHVIARAATLAAEHQLNDLVEDMAKAFEWLIKTPTRSDKGGTGLTALAKSLALLSYPNADLFRKGSFHIQMEPVYGGKVDVADHLRGWCAQGLAQTGDPNAMVDIARLLVDACSQTRKGAAAAVEISGRSDIGLPLLSMKLAIGDADPQVIGQCVTAVLHLAGADAIDLITPLLKSEDESLVEQVLLALGQSRKDEAFGLIEGFYEDCITSTMKKSALLALAMLRSDRAMNYLKDLVDDGNTQEAEHAIEALGIYSYDQKLKADILQICQDREDAFLLKQAQTVFG